MGKKKKYLIMCTGCLQRYESGLESCPICGKKPIFANKNFVPGEKYQCKKCGFEYRFEAGAFKQIDKAAVRELKKCPKCEVKMEVVK